MNTKFLIANVGKFVSYNISSCIDESTKVRVPLKTLVTSIPRHGYTNIKAHKQYKQYQNLTLIYQIMLNHEIRPVEKAHSIILSKKTN